MSDQYLEPQVENQDSGVVTWLAHAYTEKSHCNTKLMQGRQSSQDKISRANFNRGAQI